MSAETWRTPLVTATTENRTTTRPLTEWRGPSAGGRWPHLLPPQGAEGAREALRVALRGRRPPCAREPDLWFAENAQDRLEAKAVCASCPVRRQCRAYAEELRPAMGVWAGTRWLDGKPMKKRVNAQTTTREATA